MSLSMSLIESMVNPKIGITNKQGEKVGDASFIGYQCVENSNGEYVHTPLLNVPATVSGSENSSMTLLDLERKGYNVTGLPEYVQTDDHRKEIEFMTDFFK